MDFVSVPKLQFAIDSINLDQISRMVDEAVLGDVDIIEIGSSVIIKHGLGIVMNICQKYSATPVYADIKMVDFPEIEVKECLQAGATFFSVMVFTNKENIIKSLELATLSHATAVFSTMGYPLNIMKERIMDVLNWGGNYFIAHGSGASLKNAFSDMKKKAEILSEFDNVKLVLAGGITESNIKRILKYSPEIIIIGRGISQQKDIKSTIQRIKTVLRNTSWGDK